MENNTVDTERDNTQVVTVLSLLVVEGSWYMRLGYRQHYQYRGCVSMIGILYNIIRIYWTCTHEIKANFR